MDNYIVVKTIRSTDQQLYLYLSSDSKMIWCADQDLGTLFSEENADCLTTLLNSHCDHDNYLFSATVADIYVIKNILSGYYLLSYVNECIHWTDLLEDANHFNEKSKAETVVKGLSVLFGDSFTVETLTVNPEGSD